MDSYYIVESEIRNKYASVVWSHKIQEKQADIYTNRYKILETVNIACASLTSVGIVSLIFTDKLWVKIISALLSFCSVFASAYFKSFKVNDLIKAHKSTANQLLKIRDNLETLLMDIKIKKYPVEEISNVYKEILVSLHSIYEEAPSTTDKAVEKAREALHTLQDNTFSDEEINSFLPKGLRR